MPNKQGQYQKFKPWSNYGYYNYSLNTEGDPHTDELLKMYVNIQVHVYVGMYQGCTQGMGLKDPGFLTNTLGCCYGRQKGNKVCWNFIDKGFWSGIELEMHLTCIYEVL